MTPFPLPRHKIQAYKDNQRNWTDVQWGNAFQFSAPPVTQASRRKRAPGKIRAWQTIKARYNLRKTMRPNTPKGPVTNLDSTDMDKAKALLSVKVCERFRPSCLFCKQNILHLSPQELDWSD